MLVRANFNNFIVGRPAERLRIDSASLAALAKRNLRNSARLQMPAVCKIEQRSCRFWFLISALDEPYRASLSTMPGPAWPGPFFAMSPNTWVLDQGEIAIQGNSQMRHLSFVVVVFLIAACAPTGPERTNEQNPTVSYTYSSGDVEETKQNAAKYCSENYGRSARIVDDVESNDKRVMTFECVVTP